MNHVDLVEFVQSRLNRVRDSGKAAPMAAYMKTDMPFYGVQKPERARIYREMRRLFKPESQSEYEAGVESLWKLAYREEKYTALEFALQHKRFITLESLDLYEKLIREGAWWDFVDLIAASLVGHILTIDRSRMRPVLDRWIDDGHLWIRRTAIICQLRHKQSTDPDQLFGYCLKRVDEKEFFIRKAIGWALREYSKSAPHDVMDFLICHQDELSGLSFREGLKHLKRIGMMN